jgi:C1A family cysteine protease
MAGDYPEEYQVDWRPAVKNQGPVGSCVAHATSEILEWFH